MVCLGKSRVKDMFVNAKSDLFRLARDMRKNPTEPEKILWEHLRTMRSAGYVFRRQHPVDFFIADFYCHSLKLVIEIDGKIHSDISAKEYDNNRSGELERFGIKVIRFKNEEIINNLDSVLNSIKLIINKLSSPSHPGRGGQEGVRSKGYRGGQEGVRSKGYRGGQEGVRSKITGRGGLSIHQLKPGPELQKIGFQ